MSSFFLLKVSEKGHAVELVERALYRVGARHERGGTILDEIGSPASFGILVQVDGQTARRERVQLFVERLRLFLFGSGFE